MSTGNFDNWDGNITGPRARSIRSSGLKVLMVVILVVLWVAWHVAQMIGEKRDLEDRDRQLEAIRRSCRRRSTANA